MLTTTTRVAAVYLCNLKDERNFERNSKDDDSALGKIKNSYSTDDGGTELAVA
jgi:hypothetical protein